MILQQPGSEQIMRHISSGSVLVDDLLTLLELAMVVLAVSSLTYPYVELKGIEMADVRRATSRYGCHGSEESSVCRDGGW